MNHKYIQGFVVALLIALLSGCGKTSVADITQITSKSLSTTAELSDYEVVNDSFFAIVTIDNAPSLRYLADDACTISDWKMQFDPYIIFADGTQVSLAIGDTTVNQKGNDTVTISFEVSAYIQSQNLEDAHDFEIHIAGFEDDFELHSLQVA